MNEEEIRKEIYRRLGLEFGSLKEEGGNDWVRIEKEILDELRENENKKRIKSLKDSHSNLDKNSSEFKKKIRSNNVKDTHFKYLISNRKDLDNEDLKLIIDAADKDVYINIIRNYELDDELIESIIKSRNCVYLVKKYLINYQNLSRNNIDLLLSDMKKFPDIYSKLIEKIK